MGIIICGYNLGALLLPLAVGFLRRHYGSYRESSILYSSLVFIAFALSCINFIIEC
jgi:hypothetical protein